MGIGGVDDEAGRRGDRAVVHICGGRAREAEALGAGVGVQGGDRRDRCGDRLY